MEGPWRSPCDGKKAGNACLQLSQVDTSAFSIFRTSAQSSLYLVCPPVSFAPLSALFKPKSILAFPLSQMEVHFFQETHPDLSTHNDDLSFWNLPALGLKCFLCPLVF